MEAPFTSADIGRLLARAARVDRQTRQELLETAGRYPHKMVATLLSAWHVDGASLSGFDRAELQRLLSRRDSYAAVRAALADRHPQLMVLKGAEFEALYPPGILRHTNDIDFAAPDVQVVVRVVDDLQRQGWIVDGFALMKLNGDPETLLTLSRDRGEHIELTTLALVGDFAGVPPLRPADLPGSGLVAALLLLVGEGLDRDFGCRDLLDSSLALCQLTPDARAELVEHVRRAQLIREWNRLAYAFEKTWIRPAPIAPLREPRFIAATAGRRGRALRARMHLRRSLLLTMQRRMQGGHDSSAEKALWERVEALWPASFAFDNGLPVYGYRLGAGTTKSAGAIETERRGRELRAHTPFGTFQLVAGNQIGNHLLDDDPG